MRLQAVSLPGQGTLVSERLQEIRSKLQSGGGTTEDILFFAEALFGRAPDDFLRRSSKDTLVEISSDVSSITANFIAGKRPYAIEIKNSALNSERGTYTSFFSVSTDRPFIIDSLAELFRSRGIKHHVLLHPVIRTEAGTILSLVYVELDRLESETARQELRAAAENVLDDVVLITSDFEALLSKARLARDWIKLLPPDPLEEDEERAEIGNFLQWLIDGGFVFLGYREWEITKPGLKKREFDLGLFHSKNSELKKQLEEAEKDASWLAKSPGHFHFSKLHTESSVHRKSKLDFVTVKAQINGETIIAGFLGLLTSKALSQEASSIPLIERKIATVLKQEGFLPNSHDYKELVSLISTLPKGDLLQFGRETIRQDLQMMMGIQRRNETKVIVREHSLKRFFAISVFMPRDRFSSGALQRFQRYLRRTFPYYDRGSSYSVASNEDLLVGLYFLIPNPEGGPLPASVEDIERNLSELSLSWEEKLDLLLSRENGRDKGIRLSSLYNEVFPDSYKAGVSHRESLIDIHFLECLSDENPVVLDLRHSSRNDNDYILKIYKRGYQLTLSELLPYLENVGFDVQSETVTKLSKSHESEGAWGAIHTLIVRPPGALSIEEQNITTIILPGLRALLLKEAENDRLNGLLLHAALNIREISLLRAMGHYLWQIKESPSEILIANALLASPDLASLIVKGFAIKFSIEEMSVATRHAKLSEIKKRFFTGLQKVSVLAHDRVLRALFNVLESIVRTNFYQKESVSISFKVECSKITRMPEPRPLYEIFVCAPHFEGIHLRGGRVARGGIRWSERPDDYRTEIFGLMKTQMMKNSIIVPVGAKGGFIVKGSSQPSRESVVSCYKDYIRSLLDITDNLIEGKVVPPNNVIRHDGDDPYFVVAADKGTAALSDVANDIAVKEFNFWLGDAFASGGSQGYSHKSFGITARGVWETTKRHFLEMSHDLNTKPFTVVGIGDMSGDVFGNGLIISDKAKLIGAFDHRHIFLDPAPDPKISFAERKRLFDLPSSSWKDYNTEIISTGGGVFDRAQKEILLSEEAKNALGTKEESVSGIELIRLILKAPVDLIWNGGIGTYFKSSDEHNVSVGDRSNDDVRIDATEIRAKIVSEGGNLGLTQSARVEYASLGGRINTDAVDNSGGVNLSDLEVNIKILLAQAVIRKKLSLEDRNKLLMEVADEVCQSVLKRNALQAEAISTGTLRSKQNLTYYRGVIGQFEKEKLLDRKADVLPDEETLLERSKRKVGLLRPEMAILLACTKLRVADIVLESHLPEDPGLEELLFNYFPERLRQMFSDEIRNHPLRREIIAAQIANLLGERMGATFLFRVVEELGSSEEAIVGAFLASEKILNASRLAALFEKYDNSNSAKRYLSSVNRLSTTLDNLSRWVLLGGITGVKLGCINEVQKHYEKTFQGLSIRTQEFLPNAERKAFEEDLRRYTLVGFSQEAAFEAAALPFASAYMDICQLSEAHKIPADQIVKIYGSIASELRVTYLLELVSKIEVSEHWDVTAQRTLGSAIRRTPGLILQEIISYPEGSLDDKLRQFRAKHEKGLQHFLQHLKEADGRPLSISALLVLSNQLAGFWREG